MSTASKVKPVAPRCPYCGVRVKPAGTGPQTCPACTLEFTLRDETPVPVPEPDPQRPVLRDLAKPKPGRGENRAAAPDAIGGALIVLGVFVTMCAAFNPMALAF